MASKPKTTYKGIAVFGAPGTGKTTIAKALLAEIENSKYLEASHTIINPAISLKDKLPKRETQFINLIGKIYNKPLGN